MTPELCLDPENSKENPKYEPDFYQTQAVTRHAAVAKLCRDRQTVPYADIVRCFPNTIIVPTADEDTSPCRKNRWKCPPGCLAEIIMDWCRSCE